MKKINIFELVSIGIIILIGCLIVSITAKKVAGIDSDFLTAAATLFTGVVAYKLFNDWRLQYRTELFERLKDRIHNLFINIESQYAILYDTAIINENQNDKHKISNELIKLLGLTHNLEIEFDFYEKIINKYNLDTTNIKLPSIIKDELKNLRIILTGEEVEGSDVDSNLIEHVKLYLRSHDAYDFILPNKTKVNRDLQTLILILIDKQKGH